MPFVYILFSPSADSYYTGATTTDVSSRLEKHMQEYYGAAYTASKKDWQIFLQIECTTIQQALHIEKHIKKMKSKKYINDLVAYPAIVAGLKEKYKD